MRERRVNPVASLAIIHGEGNLPLGETPAQSLPLLKIGGASHCPALLVENNRIATAKRLFGAQLSQLGLQCL